MPLPCICSGAPHSARQILRQLALQRQAAPLAAGVERAAQRQRRAGDAVAERELADVHDAVGVAVRLDVERDVAHAILAQQVLRDAADGEPMIELRHAGAQIARDRAVDVVAHVAQDELVIADVERQRVDGERAVDEAAQAVAAAVRRQHRVPARVLGGELAIAARPVEPVDGEIERAVGGERAQRIGREPHVAVAVDVVDEAGERARAFELDGERVEVEAGEAAVRERRQRRQPRDFAVDVVGDGAARALEAERGVERDERPLVAGGGDVRACALRSRRPSSTCAVSVVSPCGAPPTRSARVRS